MKKKTKKILIEAQLSDNSIENVVYTPFKLDSTLSQDLFKSSRQVRTFIDEKKIGCWNLMSKAGMITCVSILSRKLS